MVETLSREMILKELPGPQLNRWVHENVMAVPRLYAYFDQSKQVLPEANKEKVNRDRALAEQIPSYSTDISTAWEVIVELNSRGLPFTINFNEHGELLVGSGFINVSFPEQNLSSGNGFTAPEAICKVALLVVEDHLRPG